MSDNMQKKTAIDPNPIEKQGEVRELSPREHQRLRRDLKSRHVSMIAVAGGLGTGLVIGSGAALVKGGPASLLLAYIFMGVCIYYVMAAVGEMASFLPMDKGFAGYATRFVDPAFGFATGWNYFLKYCIVLPNNLTAAGIIIQWWRPDLNVAIWVISFGIVMVFINFLHVSYFGEMEFWMSTVKLLAITLMILTCFVISLGGQPSGQRIGFHYWKQPGGFAEYKAEGALGRFLGFWACMIQSAFSYAGTEIVGVAFGETPDPKKNVPKAIRQTLLRICAFYLTGAIVIGMSVAYNDERLVGATGAKISAGASPFVVAIQAAGIPTLPDIVNALLLVFVLSAANADIYIASRALYSLAKDGQAPHILCRSKSNGVPFIAVGVASLFILLGLMNVGKSASNVFQYFVSVVTIMSLLNWASILISYIRFTRAMSAQGISRKDMPYNGFLQPYGSYFALVVTLLVAATSGFPAFIHGFDFSVFITTYIGLAVYVLNILLWKIVKKTSKVPLKSVDLDTDRQTLL